MGSLARRPRRHRRWHPRGFTLLELMLVLAVLGVLFSLAAVVLPSRGEAEARQESARLVRVLRAVQREALLQGRPAGLQVEPPGYGIWLFDLAEQQWQPAAETRGLLAPRDLAALGLRLELLGREEPGPRGAAPGGIEAGGEAGPAIVFDGVGVGEPYRLALALGATGHRVALLAGDGVNDPVLE